jgi:hypothetical protein
VSGAALTARMLIAVDGFASRDPYAVTRQSYASPPSRTLHAAEITILIY